jgi:hypothetical protein
MNAIRGANFVIAFGAKLIVKWVGIVERQVTRHREHPQRNPAM